MPIKAIILTIIYNSLPTCVKGKYDYKMGMTALIQVILVLGSCIWCTYTDLEDKVVENHKVFKNIAQNTYDQSARQTKRS